MNSGDKNNSDLFSELGQRYRSARGVTLQEEETQKSDRQKLIDASIEQQMLYEKWLKLDRWLLRSQALPLLLGAEPDEWQAFLDSGDGAELEATIWQGMQAGVRSDASPRVENSQQGPDEWTVQPQDIHYWARSQTIAVPSAYDMLISFVSSSVKKEVQDESVRGASQFMAANTADDRERVLGAALAMVCTFPEQCRDNHGWVDGYTLAKLIEEKGALVFEDQPPVLNTSEMAELLDHWIKKME